MKRHLPLFKNVTDVASYLTTVPCHSSYVIATFPFSRSLGYNILVLPSGSVNGAKLLVAKVPEPGVGQVSERTVPSPCSDTRLSILVDMKTSRTTKMVVLYPFVVYGRLAAYSVQ